MLVYISIKGFPSAPLWMENDEDARWEVYMSQGEDLGSDLHPHESGVLIRGHQGDALPERVSNQESNSS